jgi:hypothetical protein
MTIYNSVEQGPEPLRSRVILREPVSQSKLCISFLNFVKGEAKIEAEAASFYR